MRARSMILLLALLAACTKHEAPPDPLVAELRTGIAQTLAAMGEPALDARALDDESLRLAWIADRERIAAVRSGAVGATQLAAAAHGIVRGIETGHPTVKAPQVLVWLAAHADALGLEQRLLLEASSEQAGKELPKPPQR